MSAPVGDISTFRLTARFRDPALEAAFQKESFPLSVRGFTRFSLALAGVVFLAYGVHDLLVVPEVHRLAWELRYGVFAPVCAAVLFLTRTRHYKTWHQPAVLIYGLAVNVVVLGIASVASTAGFFLYSSYAVVFVTIGPYLGKMNVETQLSYTVLTVLLFDVLDVFVTHSPPMIRLSLNISLLSLGLIGVVIAHLQESQARQSFLQRRTIKRQMVELDEEKSKSEALLLNILPAPIAQRLKQEEGKAIADGFAEVTVLFSDIVGFTQMSARLSPEELVRRLNAIFSTFDDLADRLGLEKIKTIGDAYMVASGLPEHRDDHAQAIAEMALEMRAFVEEFSRDTKEQISVRIGVHSGPAVAGVIGKKKFIYDVWGDTVNTASRMESHGIPGEIQVSDTTYELLKEAYELEPRGQIDVKGKGIMTTYLLKDRIARVTRPRLSRIP